jgi:SRSO17 transposase
MRWPIETCFEDSQPWLGMGDDEVRCWTGWYHHLCLVLLAHFWGVCTMLTME